MALVANAENAATTRLGDRDPITLLFVCAPGDETGELRGRLESIAAHYGDLVRLEVVCPGDVPQPHRRAIHAGPTVLVLRGGEIVGEAMGSRLPARELDRVVRCAVEWPDV